MTKGQIDFANRVSNIFAARYPESKLFIAEQKDAIERQDVKALAKVIGKLIVELGYHGEAIAPFTAEWVKHFGNTPLISE